MALLVAIGAPKLLQLLGQRRQAYERLAGALADGLALHAPSTAHGRVLEQIGRLRDGAADGGSLFAQLPRPDAALLDQQTLVAMQGLDSAGWRLLFHLLERGGADAERDEAVEVAAAVAAAAGADLGAGAQLGCSGDMVQNVVALLATFASSARAALDSLGPAGLLRCDGHARPSPAVPYARAARPTASAATRQAAQMRLAQRAHTVEYAQLVVASDPSLAALRPLLCPGQLPTAACADVLRAVLALRQGDADIGATQVDPTADVLDAVHLAADRGLGLQARTARARGSSHPALTSRPQRHARARAPSRRHWPRPRTLLPA